MELKIEPKFGELITVNSDNSLKVPNKVVIPFIEGDGIGSDISPVMQKVLDAAVAKAYGDKKRIDWLEIFMGEKAAKLYDGNYMPQQTLDLMKKYVVSIKGPLTTPVGEGIRSLNVAIRQALDLYVCLRPVKYFEGTPTVMKNSDQINMVIFRENTEDVYTGIEWQAHTPEVKKLVEFLQGEMAVDKIPFPNSTAIGIKPISEDGSKRLVRKAIRYALDYDLPSITVVHKGNIMKFTEGAFKKWAYETATKEFGAVASDNPAVFEVPNPRTGNKIIIKNVIADAFLQQIILRPEEYSVIATLNLNGDYISDALAALVGGIGIAPGANLGDELAVFEATHGSAPKYTGQDKVNPGSIILSGEMMLMYLGWTEAASLINKAMEKTIQKKTVTYDLARQMQGAVPVSCSAFGEELIKSINSF